MSIDSSGAAPLQEQRPDAPPCTDVPAQAKARKPRKPRPTFEDGALTRVFKFPSKTYPRSSYYVTSTEIIIRIKKARKKWKMTIPKKRVVSYRTNRWFAKPRWIAIELTYTQAVKLGLAEARPRAPEAASATAPDIAINGASPAVAGIAPVASAVAAFSETAPVAGAAADELRDASGTAETGTADGGAEWSASSIPSEGDDPAEPEEIAAEQEGADLFELSLDTEDSEIEGYETDDDIEAIDTEVGDVEVQSVEAREVEPATPDAAAPLSTPAPASAEIVPEAPVASSVVPQEEKREPVVLAFPAVTQAQTPVRAPAPAPRRQTRHAFATLAAALACYAVWAAFDASRTVPTPDCAPHCGSPIVTGALGPAPALQLPVAPPEIEMPLTPSEIAAIARTELEVQARADQEAEQETKAESARVETSSVEKPETEAVAIVLPERDLVLPLSPPLITASVEVPQQPAAAQVPCDTLGETARHLRITFDYARSQFDPAAVPGLDDVASLLRSCADSKVLIEGHTDSDGRSANNRSLSLRRAQAVQKYLVDAGVAPHRVEAVGFGQTRPAVPNVTPQNKRSNRRVVLVVIEPR